VAVLLSGLVFSELCNYLLKNLIKSPRPYNKWTEELARKQCFSYGDERYDAGYGMPSAHSQFMSFFAGFLLLPRLGKWKLWSNGTAIVLWSIVVCLSRVHHEYHTIEQVITGCFIGAVLSVIWRKVWVSNRWQLMVKLRTWLCRLFDIQPPEMEEVITQKKES
jgi:dolichyldiphosphatase